MLKKKNLLDDFYKPSVFVFFNVSMLYHCVNRELCQWVSELQTVDNTCSLGVTETLSR